MMFQRPHPATVGSTQYHGYVKTPPRPASQANGVVFHLVHAHVAKAGKLDFAHRTEPFDGHADGNPANSGLGKGSIHNSLRTELFNESIGDSKNATIHSYILAQNDYTIVLLHFLVQGEVDRLNHCQFSHCSIPLLPSRPVPG